ncbi:DUF2514 family protein [Variovorax sp. JS1663]|uniref:DUF2514 family protein n=1 Tax=Variovorax sp. JS1663 TaxID=1851577 RepID=UPI00117D3F44|nr:DUF2514 family protein [Variovorax sp. JS1663]
MLNPYILLGGLLAILAAAGGGYWKGSSDGANGVQTKWSAQVIADQKAALEAANENQRIAARWNSNLIGAINESRKRAQLLEAAAAGATAERGRLLDAIRRATSRPVPSDPGKASPEPANPLADVLGACTAEVQDLARAADGHASDVQTLTDGWPAR